MPEAKNPQKPLKEKVDLDKLQDLAAQDLGPLKEALHNLTLKLRGENREAEIWRAK